MIDHLRPAFSGLSIARIESLFRLDGENATELLLVRHAQPECCHPLTGEALSDLGVSQAQRLADALAGQMVDAIYTAPEPAAKQTVQIIGRVTGKDAVTVSDLHDVEVQPYLNDDEAVRCFAYDLAELFARRPRWDSLPGFEASRSFRHRAIQALEAIVAHHAASRVVVVTHAAVINAYLSMLLDIPRDLFFVPDFCSVSTVRIAEDRYALRTLNDTSHLRSIVSALSR